MTRPIDITALDALITRCLSLPTTSPRMFIAKLCARALIPTLRAWRRITFEQLFLAQAEFVTIVVTSNPLRPITTALTLHHWLEEQKRHLKELEK